MTKVKRILLSVIFCIFFVAFDQSLGYCRLSYTEPAKITDKGRSVYNFSNVLFFCEILGYNNVIDDGVYKHKSLGKFVYVLIFVENRKNDAIVVDNSYFKLVDMKTGTQYSVSSQAQLIADKMIIDSHNDNIVRATMVDLNPNMKVGFMLVFDVPRFLLDKEVGVLKRDGMRGTSVIMKPSGSMKKKL